MNRQRKETTSR
jgi:hypothetical protein